jgi:Flp pilus assembly pilin Flp
MPLVMTLVAVALVWIWTTLGGWIAKHGRSNTAAPRAKDQAGDAA